MFEDHFQNQSLDHILLRRTVHGAVEPLTALGSIAARDTLEDHVQS